MTKYDLLSFARQLVHRPKCKFAAFDFTNGFECSFSPAFDWHDQKLGEPRTRNTVLNRVLDEVELTLMANVCSRELDTKSKLSRPTSKRLKKQADIRSYRLFFSETSLGLGRSNLRTRRPLISELLFPPKVETRTHATWIGFCQPALFDIGPSPSWLATRVVDASDVAGPVVHDTLANSSNGNQRATK